MAESQVGAGFQAMATGDWRGARDAFSAVLAVAEVPEALFGLANALFWLGDLAGTIANCEKAYAGFRRRGDPMFAAGAALSLVGYNKGYLGNTAAARGWLSRAARIIENEAPELRGELLGATAYVTEDPVESEALARQAAEIGRANGHSDLELMAMHAVGQARAPGQHIGLQTDDAEAFYTSLGYRYQPVSCPPSSGNGSSTRLRAWSMRPDISTMPTQPVRARP